jgi:hypothetical protein
VDRLRDGEIFGFHASSAETNRYFRDQELRFTVHDSPDYYKLKVSVFNDDKKTELIGESWLSLDGTIVPGGGQSDCWHELKCKGKYAGEVRLELTYYDSRPKVEKPAPKRSSAMARDDDQSPAGSRQNTPVRRRPLPSNPTSDDPCIMMTNLDQSEDVAQFHRWILAMPPSIQTIHINNSTNLTT